MTDYTVGMAQYCHQCGTVHPFPNQHCHDCLDVVCARCMGCNCPRMRCDCSRGTSRE